MKIQLLGPSLFAILMLIDSCSWKEEKRSYLNVEEINIDLSQAKQCKLSEIVSKIEYVYLKTPPGDVLGRGSLKIGKTHFYFHDYQQSELCVFDRKGEFVAKLDKRGNGQVNMG